MKATILSLSSAVLLSSVLASCVTPPPSPPDVYHYHHYYYSRPSPTKSASFSGGSGGYSGSPENFQAITPPASYSQ